jgi:hypothetical protein
MNTRPISISLELQVDEDPFAGRATTDSGRQRDFTGWIGLLGAIDALLSLESPEEDR